MQLWIRTSAVCCKWCTDYKECTTHKGNCSRNIFRSRIQVTCTHRQKHEEIRKVLWITHRACKRKPGRQASWNNTDPTHTHTHTHTFGGKSNVRKPKSIRKVDSQFWTSRWTCTQFSGRISMNLPLSWSNAFLLVRYSTLLITQHRSTGDIT
jgi:hypothetical protein